MSKQIKNKYNIKDTEVIQIPNSAGGNCFFKAISQFFNKTEIYHIYYRYKICKLIESKKHIDLINYPYIYGNNNTWLTYEQNFNNIIHTGGYVGGYEIINTCIAFRCNICIYKYDDNMNEYIYETIKSNQDQYNPFLPTILIAWINNNHYELLLPKTINYENLPIEYKNHINLMKNLNNRDNNNSKLLKENKTSIVNNDIKYKNSFVNYNSKSKIKHLNYEEKDNNSDTELNISESKDISDNKINLNEMYKNELKNYIINKDSIYPKLKGCKNGSTRLEDILKYLQSSYDVDRRNNSKKIWPKFIIEAEEHNKNINKSKEDKEETKSNIEKKLKNKKKGRNSTGIEFDKNELINIKNLKTQFKRVCNNYLIKEGNKLYYLKNTKHKTTDNKFIIIKEEYYVPTVEELNILLYKFHTKTIHSNYKEMIRQFNNEKIGFPGLEILLEEYVNNCQVCTQNSRVKRREDPIKSIEFNGPDYAYTFDITYLNSDMAESFGIKYILSIMDCFSRKAMIYGTNSKSADELLKFIKDFCLNNAIPKVFISDNGAEFKNSLFDNFCQEYQISFRHGKPYSPHSQGGIERFNYTIKKYLGKEYITNGKNKLDFETAKFKIINFYNNKVHRLLGITPNQAYKITDNTKINELNKIKTKEFDKINNKRNYLEVNDTCLLNPKLSIIGKNTIIPNRVKKGKFNVKIPVRILKHASFGYYLIKIEIDFETDSYLLKAGEEYSVDSYLLKKINAKTWKAIIRNNSNINDSEKNKKKKNKKKVLKNEQDNKNINIKGKKNKKKKTKK